MIGVRKDQGFDFGEASAAGKVLEVGVVVSLDVNQALEALTGKLWKVVDTHVQVLQSSHLSEGMVVDTSDFVVWQITAKWRTFKCLFMGTWGKKIGEHLQHF